MQSGRERSDEGVTAPQGKVPAEHGRVSAPTLSLPKGGGAIRGIGEKFAANPVTGTGSISVPVPTSPGRSGFGPQLSLSYDSGAGNGPFGFGWTLSTPAMVRKTDKGLPVYEDAAGSDVFILSGAEDLVPVRRPDGSLLEDTASAPGFTIRRYRPRIEGLFARIERWTQVASGETHWRSITRDNVATFYGKTNESRLFDPADPDPLHPSRIFGWLISETFDDKGNVAEYHYKAEDAAGSLLDGQIFVSGFCRTGAKVDVRSIIGGFSRPTSAHLLLAPRGKTQVKFPMLQRRTPWPKPAASLRS